MTRPGQVRPPNPRGTSNSNYQERP
jgi:hypothetical protein